MISGTAYRVLRRSHFAWGILVAATLVCCLLLLTRLERQMVIYKTSVYAFREPRVMESERSIINSSFSIVTNGSSFTTTEINSQRYNYNYTQLLKPTGSYEGLEFLIVVASAVPNLKRRNAVRESLFKQMNAYSGANLSAVFLLGFVGKKRLQESVVQEQAQFGDIVQFNFSDSFRNATIKSVIMLHWASQYRPMFLVKADDDTMINVAKMCKDVRSIQKKIAAPFFIAGHKQIKVVPRRKKNDKWSLSKQEYPGKLYPDFVVGCIYVISGTVLNVLYETALTTRPVSLEDVFITGILATKAQVPRENLTHIEPLGLKNTCEVHNKLAVHHISASRMRELSQVLLSTVRLCSSTACSCVIIKANKTTILGTSNISETFTVQIK